MASISEKHWKKYSRKAPTKRIFRERVQVIPFYPVPRVLPAGKLTGSLGTTKSSHTIPMTTRDFPARCFATRKAENTPCLSVQPNFSPETKEATMSVMARALPMAASATEVLHCPIVNHEKLLANLRAGWVLSS